MFWSRNKNQTGTSAPESSSSMSKINLKNYETAFKAMKRAGKKIESSVQQNFPNCYGSENDDRQRRLHLLKARYVIFRTCPDYDPAVAYLTL